MINLLVNAYQSIASFAPSSRASRGRTGGNGSEQNLATVPVKKKERKKCGKIGRQKGTSIDRKTERRKDRRCKDG
jgi:hypothetical protein